MNDLFPRGCRSLPGLPRVRALHHTNRGFSHDCSAGADRHGRAVPPLFPRVTMTKAQFTYEQSDHLPLWMEVDTDVDDERLEQVLAGKKR